MANGQKVAVFSSFRPFLHILNIYDWKRFQIQDRRLLLRNICEALVVSVFALAFIAANLCNVWYCLSHSFNVAQIPLAIAILINQLQFVITYIAIRRKNDLINEIIAGIGEIVNKRN